MTDVVDAVRVLVQDPRLSGYFHLGQSGRTGVQVVDATSATGVTSVRTLTPQVTIAPTSSAIAAGRIPLYIDSAKCDEQAASLAWRLPAEGLSGAASLRRSAGRGWTVETFRLVER